MALEAKAARILSVGEECIEPSELHQLLQTKDPVCYDGFEPSGRIHIAQGVMKAVNVNKLTQEGCKFKFWVADWFAHLNHKMGGDLGSIRTVGEYMIQIWKAVGMDMENVEFLWSSEEINARCSEYWSLVFDIAQQNTLTRLLRCSEVMGRNNLSKLYVSAILYACMQCADVFFLKADICQLGLDQRKVNMLAREYAELKKHRVKPIILSHHMLPGLLEGQSKMSKSNEDSAIFMDDSEAKVCRKIHGAYCPADAAKNPCLEYIKYIVLPRNGRIEIETRDGVSKVYSTSEELYADWQSELIPADHLKTSLATALNSILQPVRDRLGESADARELVEKVNGLKVTRHLEEASADLAGARFVPTSGLQSLREFLPERPVCFVSLEPVGRMPVAQALLGCMVNQLLGQGFAVKLFIHDWLVKEHASKLRSTGESMLDAWKATGMKVDEVEVIWSSEVTKSLAPLLLEVSRRWHLPSLLKILTKTDSCDENTLSAEQRGLAPSGLLDACIHCASVLLVKPAICLLPIDKCELVARSFQMFQLPDPIMLEPVTLPSLHGAAGSGTNEASCLFMDDEKSKVKKKIAKAFCPPSITEGNPCIELVRHLILPMCGKLQVSRRVEHGGDKTYENSQELVEDYTSGALHPKDLKAAITQSVNEMLEPVRTGLTKA